MAALSNVPGKVKMPLSFPALLAFSMQETTLLRSSGSAI